MSTTPTNTQPPPAPPPGDKARKSFLSTLGKSLGLDPVPPIAAPAPEVVPPAPPVETPPPAPAAPPAPPAPAPEPPAPTPPPKPETSEPLPAIPEADMLAPSPEDDPTKPSTLLAHEPTPEEIEYLEVLQFAAEEEPGRYTAIFDREVDRLNKVHKFIVDFKAEHGRDPEPDDAEYKTFLRQNPPAIDAATRNRLQRQMDRSIAAADAAARTRKELEPDLKKVRAMEVKPRITAAHEQLDTELLSAVARMGDGDPLHGITKVSDLVAVPSEGKIFDFARQRARQTTEIFLRITGGLEQPDINNEYHAYIGNLINAASAEFEKNGGEHRIQEGKRFVSPAVYKNLKPAAQAKVWTWTNDEIIGIINSTAIGGALIDVENKRKERAALTEWEESKKPQKPAPPPPPPPVLTPPSPSFSPSPAAGAGGGGGSVPTPTKVPGLSKLLTGKS